MSERPLIVGSDRKPVGRTGLLVRPPDPSRKYANLIAVEHVGGGWYQAVCFGGASKCRAGECRHVTGLSMKNAHSIRPIRPRPRGN